MLDEFVDLGCFTRGTKVYLGVTTRYPNGDAAVPDDAPIASIYLPGGEKITEELPVVDRYQQRGIFGRTLLIDSRFSPGACRILYSYALGGVVYSVASRFDVADAGDPGGSVISMTNYATPQAQFIVAQLSSGKLVTGRGPSI